MILPSDDADDIVQRILYINDRTSDYLNTYRRKWYGFYKLYRSYLNLQTYPFRNKIFVPYVFPLIQTMMPRVVAGLLYKIPLVETAKAHPSTPDGSVQNVADLLNNKWLVDTQTWYMKLMMFQEALMYGTSMAKLYHSRLEKNIPYWDKPLMADGVPIIQQKRSKTVLWENRPRLEHIDLFDINMDLEHGAFPEFVCHVQIKSMDEIEFGAIEYENMDELRKDGDFRAEMSRDSSPRLTRLTSVEDDYPDMLYDINHPRQIMEMCFKEHTKEGIKYRVITLGNRKYLIRDEYIPFWPWVSVQNNPTPHEMLGVGEIEQVESLQHGYNFYVNMMMDNLLLSGTKMWAFGEAANADLDNFVVEPMGVLMVDDINAFKPIEFSDIPEKSWQLMEQFPEWMGNTVGVGDYLRGATPPRREYATTVSLLQQASEARIDLKIKMFEKLIIEPTARGFLEVAQNYLIDPEYIPQNKNGVGDWNEYTAYDIQGLIDINVASTAMGMNALTRQQLTEYATTAGQLMGQDTPLQVRMQLLTAIGRSYNIDDITKVCDELPQLVQQAQQAAQQQQQQAQAAQQTPTNGGGTPGAPAPAPGFAGSQPIQGYAATLAASQSKGAPPNGHPG